MSGSDRIVTVFAPAKINLTLHVTGQREDGYHLLDSLVVFASVGDVLQVQLAETLSVRAHGPEVAGVPTDGRNLVLKVAQLFGDVSGASVVLEKNLPVASGIGGGSADAAAAFRALWTLRSGGTVNVGAYDPSQMPLASALLGLGADIPVCLQSLPKRMQGIGEVLSDPPALPLLHAVLVNPRVEVATPAIFRALEAKTNAPMGPVLPQFDGVHEFSLWLKQQRNDLEKPACGLAPEISQCLRALASDPGCLLARMSGSGATCFGLFGSQDAAEAAAQRIVKQAPEWWVHAAQLGGMDQASLPRFTTVG